MSGGIPAPGSSGRRRCRRDRPRSRTGRPRTHQTPAAAPGSPPRSARRSGHRRPAGSAAQTPGPPWRWPDRRASPRSECPGGCLPCDEGDRLVLPDHRSPARWCSGRRHDCIHMPYGLAAGLNCHPHVRPSFCRAKASQQLFQSALPAFHAPYLSTCHRQLGRSESAPPVCTVARVVSPERRMASLPNRLPP